MRKLECKEGQKFGYWTVRSPNAFVKWRHTFVTVQCKCGKIQDLMLSDLIAGRSFGCRDCRAKDRRTPVEIGEKYQHWTVIGGPKSDKRGEIFWLCRCDCGKKEWIGSSELKNPIKRIQCRSCFLKQGRKKRLKHNGKTGELTLNRYNKIKRAAIKRSIPFEVSLLFLGNLFEKQHHTCAITGDFIDNISKASLDRIDSTKGYTEDNVQWVTKQANLSKHIMTMNELYNFCNKVISYANQKPSTPLTKCEGSETNS